MPPGKTFRVLSALALTCILISRARASPPTSPRSSFRKPERFPSHARAAPLASPSPTPATSLSSCHRKPERLPSQVPNCPSRKTEIPPASPISCLCKPERLPSHARAAPSRKPELPFPQARAHPPCKPKFPRTCRDPKASSSARFRADWPSWDILALTAIPRRMHLVSSDLRS